VPGFRLGRRSSCPGAHAAFTLVELVTASALMTVMMLGVVQIFDIITQTAGDAKGIQYAMEQGRSLFDSLHRDIQGLTRDGYLRIVKQQSTGGYSYDTLAMTSIGLWSGVWNPNDWITAGHERAPVAEVVYTRNVLTYTALLQLYPSTVTLDDRCGIIGRGQWAIAPKPAGGAGPGTYDMDDYAKVTTLCNLFNQPGAANPLANRYSNPYVKVWPVTAASGKSDQPPSLQRVMACRASEFYVEYLAYDTTATPPDYAWKSADRDLRPGNNVGCPRAIRVTIAIHDPSDRKAKPSTDLRFRGYAMQEVFWIGDP